MRPKFRSSHWALAGTAVLLVAASSATGQEKGQNEEKERRFHTFEKKIVVVDQDGDHPFAHRMLGGPGMSCTEENGRKVCVASMEKGFGFFAGTFLGVHLTETTPELREHLGGPRDAGVLVSKVEDDTPAAAAGIQVGDIVTSVDGETIESAMDLRHAIASRDDGQAVAIELYRDGRLEQVSATLARREPRDFMKRLDLHGSLLDADEIAEQVREALEGIDFEDLDAQVRKQLDAVDWERIRETVREALDRALEK